MAVCSILYQLATRPVEQQKVREELKRVLHESDDELSIQRLDQMHYLKAFIREVFRMYSTVIGNGRTLQEDTVICGYRIPKGVSNKRVNNSDLYNILIVFHFDIHFDTHRCKQFFPHLSPVKWKNSSLMRQLSNQNGG